MGKRWMAAPLCAVAMLLAPACWGSAARHDDDGAREARAASPQPWGPDTQGWALALGAFAFFGTVLRSAKDR